MLKLTGAVLLILAGTLAGYAESHKLALRVEKLESFLRFLEAAQTEIRYSGLSVERILRKHGMGLRFLVDCAGRCESGKAFGTAWREAVNRADREGFAAADRELLLGFGDGFGATDTDGQLSHCALYSSLTESSLRAAKEERKRKSRLYQALGVFAGLAATLFFC